MLNTIINALKWSLSVGFKLARVVPVYTLAGICATLLTQVTLLLTFFLPLKVIMLLGFTDVPHYFPLAWQGLNRDHLIVYLTAGAAGFYVLYLLAERVVNACGKHGAKCLLEKSKKIILFANQHEIATQFYIRYSRTLAGAVFSFLVLLFIGIFYPDLIIFLAGYGVLVFILLSVGYTWSEYFKNILTQNLSTISNIIAALGFLLAFIFMVSDFLLGRAPSVIVAIICLLLVRQLMNQLARMIIDLSILFTQRLQINALFFHGQALVTQISQQEQAFWSLLEPSRLIEWIPGVLREVTKTIHQRFDCVWHQTGIADVVAFEVTTYDVNDQTRELYLVKLFNSNRQSLALHEASLLAECESGGLPSLVFLGINNVNEHHCHIYLWGGEQKVNLLDFKLKQLVALEKLFHYVPDKNLVECYARSRQSLSQRLNIGMVMRLRLVTSNPAQLEQLDTLEQRFNWLQSRLDSLPRQIVNPDILPNTLLCNECDEVKITHWGKWGIEPLGAAWPTNEQGLIRLGEVWSQSRQYRKTLHWITEADVKLAALMFAFEYYYQRQLFIEVLSLLPVILVNIENGDADVDSDNEWKLT